MNKFAAKTKNRYTSPIDGLVQACLAVTGTSLITLGVLTPQAAKAITIYSNDFSAGAGSEWSNSTTTTSPSGERFLGRFSSQNTTLNLATPAGTNNISLSFDFYVIDSWDGNNQGFGAGPDFWGVKILENSSILSESTFNNIETVDPSSRQSFGGQGQPLGSYAPRTGALANNTLGTFATPFGDSTYHFTFNFAYNQPTLSLNFYDLGLEGVANESWGIDNIQVTSNTPAGVPWETDSLSLIGSTAIFGLGVWAKHKRNKSKLK